MENFDPSLFRSNGENAPKYIETLVNAIAVGPKTSRE